MNTLNILRLLRNLLYSGFSCYLLYLTHKAFSEYNKDFANGVMLLIAFCVTFCAWRDTSNKEDKS